MESFVLKIHGRKSGSLLQNKTSVPLDGPVLSVSNDVHKKSVRFVHTAWEKFGTKAIAGDCQGNIYVFHLQKNKFWLIQHLSYCCTFLTFLNDPAQDVIVALSDCSIVSLNSDLKITKNQFNHHKSCVTNISFHEIHRHVLSCSLDQVILWDLATFNILRVLGMKKNVDIVRAFIVPDRDIIISAFRDDSVFLWNLETFHLNSQFVCEREGHALNMRTVDASSDGKLLICAGKATWFFVWSIEDNRLLHTVSLPQNVASVKQINFTITTILSVPMSQEEYILTLLDCHGILHFYNVKKKTYFYKLSLKSDRIVSYATSLKQYYISAITLQGNLNFYDLEDICTVGDKIKTLHNGVNKNIQLYQAAVKSKAKRVCKKDKPLELEVKRLKSILLNFEAYPDKHRFFIWSQLLQLPSNEQSFNILYQDSLSIPPFDRDCSFMNPTLKKCYIRILSMLTVWCPLIIEIDYFKCLVFPFIKVLHKNIILCFELLVTLISNWSQNWFVFCPFPPFNVFCTVENILEFHDRDLIIHFARNSISAYEYAWPLLKTAFSEVFNRSQWLKLWDHIFTNSFSFLLYVAAAYNIASKDVLLRCETLDQFKSCYRRQGIPVSVVIQVAYSLQRQTPETIDPELKSRSFMPIPKSIYPSFLKMCQLEVNLETLNKKSIIDREADYLLKKKEAIEVKGNYLKELQELQMKRRKLLLKGLELENARKLEELNDKLCRVRHLIEDNLADQVSVWRSSAEANYECMLNQPEFFNYKDYTDKLKLVK